MTTNADIAITGNLSELKDIIVLDSAGFWPPAPAWYAVALFFVFLLFRLGYKAILDFQANRYRREAQQQLHFLKKNIVTTTDPEERAQAAIALPGLLKQTAVSAFPRRTVAGLNQKEWLTFLDKHCSKTTFSGKPGRLLQTCAYGTPDQISALPQDDLIELIAMIQKWIQKHETRQE